MQYKKFNNTYILRFDRNDTILDNLKNFCVKEDIKLAEISGLGFLSEVKIGYFNKDTKLYEEKVLDEGYEILGLNGNITRNNGNPHIHLHVILSKDDLSVIGGHFIDGKIGVTGEVFIKTLDGEIDRRKNEEVGIFEMDLI